MVLFNRIKHNIAFHLILIFIPSFTVVACSGAETPLRHPRQVPGEKTPPQESPPADTAPPGLPLSSISPWFKNVSGGVAAEALHENRLAEAVTLFDDLADKQKDPQLKTRAAFLAAYISYYAGDANRAYTELPKLKEKLPLLTNVIYEVSALAAFKIGKYQDSIALAQNIETENQVAELLIGDAYQQLEAYQDALRQYRKVMGKWAGSIRQECQAKIVSCIVQITEDYSHTAYELAQKKADASADASKDATEASAIADLKEAAVANTNVSDEPDTSLDASGDTNADDVTDDMADNATRDGTDADQEALSSAIAAETDDATPADTNEYLRQLIDEALEIIATLSAQKPMGKWTKEACGFEEILLNRIGEKVSVDKKETRVAQKLYEDAHEDMQRRRHSKALKGYKKAIRFAKRGGTLECRARYEQALVTSFLRNHKEAAELFEKVAADCDEPEIQLKAFYKAGKSYMSADMFDASIEMFAAVEKRFSTHSFADDARLHGARAFLAKGEEDTFLKMISTLPDDYPTGDMRAEALWVGAKRALDENHLNRAKDILQKYFDLFPVEKGWYTAGRAAYWYGRVLEQLGEVDGAVRQYEHTITTTPFTFYMVLAYSRLSAINELQAKMLAAQLTPKSGREPRTIPHRFLESGPFAEGVELIRLGLTTRGTKQIKAALKKSETPPAVHRAAATLFRHVGSFNDSKEITVALDNGWQNRYPAGEDYDAWTLAYPKAYNEDVSFASAESGVDSALILAIMREESSFNATIESWANAMGLMQLILPTARAMGKELGIKVNRKSLKNPRTNIRLGATYLKNLGDSFDNHPALMIPGYNAGGGAVSRWLRENKDMALDLWVESISYSQTRGYTKRVLATYATYRFLYEENNPFTVLDLELPKK